MARRKSRKKSKAEIREFKKDDKGPDAIWRDGYEGPCKSCFGKGKIFARDDEKEEHGRECRACFGKGHVKQLAHEDFDSLITTAMQTSTIERRVNVGRRQSNVDRLYAAGKIDKRLHDAALDFKDDFDKGHLSGVSASSFLNVPGGGNGDRAWSMFINKARRRIRQAILIMGGYGSRKTSIAWDLIGLELPMTKVIGQDGGQQRALLTANLIEALKDIAAFYRPEKGA